MSDQDPKKPSADLDDLRQKVTSGQMTPQQAIAAMVPEWDQDVAALIVFGWVGKHAHIIELDEPENQV